MKRCYLIGGPMGVGKTTVCRLLKEKTSPSVFLDGDWCWDMSPFQVTPETQAMVLDNICHLLNNFLRCSTYDTVIFCWVMHQQEIIDTILSHLELSAYQIIPVSLTCRADQLRRRLEQDIQAGLRKADVVDRSLSYLPLYSRLNTFPIDATDLSPEEIAAKLVQLSENER